MPPAEQGPDSRSTPPPRRLPFISVRRQADKQERRAKRSTRLFIAFVVALLLTTTAGANMPSFSDYRVSTAAPTPTPKAAPQTFLEFEQALVDLDAGERRTRAELAAVNKKLDLVRAHLIARGRAYFRAVRAGLLPVGGGFDGVVDHATRMERLRTALKRDIALRKHLEVRRTALLKKMEGIGGERAPLMAHREAMKRAESAMQQADERRAAFDRAFGHSELPPHMAIYGGTGPIDGSSSTGIEDARGRLSFPLAGRAEVLHAPESQATLRGLQLVASRDTAVRGVYAGRVAFAGPTEHGLTIVLDHGDNHFSLYGGLQRAEVKVGDAIAERARLGWVLRHGARPPRLYFELRRGNDLIDANAWLGL